MSAAPIYESVDAAARLMAVDSDADSLENTNPIFGVDEAPDLSFKDAAKCAQAVSGLTDNQMRLLAYAAATGKCTLYRGVKLNLAAKFPKGKRFVWWSVTSATTNASVLNNEQFLGESGERTLFTIQVLDARDITRFSAVKAEAERVILPGTLFVVKDVLPLGNGLTMIQIEQVEDAPNLIDVGEDTYQMVDPATDP
eukprot:gene8099-26901_t